MHQAVVSPTKTSSYALGEDLKRQLRHLSSLQRLREELNKEIPCASGLDDDVSILVRGLDRLLAFATERDKNNDQYLAQFNTLFEMSLKGIVEAKDVADWQRRWHHKSTPEMKKLKLVFNTVADSKLATHDIKKSEERITALQQTVNRWENEARTLMGYLHKGRGSSPLSNNEVFPHLHPIADHLQSNALTPEQADIFRELVKKSEQLMDSRQMEHFQMEAHFQAIEQLTGRFTMDPCGVLGEICKFLKIHMHVLENAVHNQLSRQVTEQLEAMKRQTDQLVRNLSEHEGLQSNQQHEHESCKKKLELYEIQLLELHSKVEQKAQQCDSLRRSRETDRFRDESCANHIAFLENENASLKAALSNQPEVCSASAYESEILKLQTQLHSIQAELEVLTNNEVQDQAEINRLNLLISDYEQQENSSRRQLEELVSRVNFRQREKREQAKDRKLSTNEQPSEEFVRLRLRELEEDVSVYITVNEIYVDNQKNLEARVAELSKQNAKLQKHKTKLEEQIKELNGCALSMSGSREASVVPNGEGLLIHGLEEEWAKKERQLNDKILRLTFSLETIKAEYLDEVRRRGANTQRLQEIAREEGGFVDDRVELYAEKRVLEDQNRSLLEALDKAQVQLSEAERLNRKLLKSEKDKIRLVEHLQRQNLQLSNIQTDPETQRTWELTSGRQPRRTNNYKSDELQKELNELQTKVRLLQEEKEFYVRTIEDQIINSRTIELESRLEEQREKISELERMLATREQQLKCMLTADNSTPAAGIQKLNSDSVQQAMLTDTVRRQQKEIAWLQESLNKLHLDHELVCSENEKYYNETKRLETLLFQSESPKPYISRLPLRENGESTHPPMQSSDYQQLRDKLIESLGWREVVPLFTEYLRTRKQENLLKLEKILLG